MTNYDIVHVEDDNRYSGLVERRAIEAGLTYVNFPALDELEAALPETSARFWVTDGRFPKTRGGGVENNSTRAVELIRRCDPNARIALHSSGTFARSDAIGLEIKWFDKDSYTAKGLVDKIKEILGEN